MSYCTITGATDWEYEPLPLPLSVTDAGSVSDMLFITARPAKSARELEAASSMLPVVWA